MIYATTGDITRQINRDRDQVNCALREVGITPVRRTGVARSFDSNDVQAVQDFLASRTAYAGSTHKLEETKD